MMINQEVKEIYGLKFDLDEVVILSIDNQQMMQFRSVTNLRGRSVLHIGCFNSPPGAHFAPILLTERDGMTVDNVSFCRSFARGDKLAISNRDLTDHILLALPTGCDAGTVFYSGPCATGRRPVPFKMAVAAEVIARLTDWLFARRGAANGGLRAAEATKAA